jgi:hypothetical protein
VSALRLPSDIRDREITIKPSLGIFKPHTLTQITVRLTKGQLIYYIGKKNMRKWFLFSISGMRVISKA